MNKTKPLYTSRIFAFWCVSNYVWETYIVQKIIYYRFFYLQYYCLDSHLYSWMNKYYISLKNKKKSKKN